MNMYVHLYEVFLQEPLTYMFACTKCFMMKVCAHVHKMFHHESMRPQMHVICCIMKVCAHLHKILWTLTCIKCFMMKECAPTCIILFPYQSMCSRAYVSVWKYVLTYIVCLIMEVCALCIVCLIMEICALCIVCFLIAMKGIHIDMQTGVCQRF